MIAVKSMSKVPIQNYRYRRYREMTNWSREELYEKVLDDEEFAVQTICKFDWIFGAFMSTLQYDFHFGKRRMREVLKGVQKRFNRYNQFPWLDFTQYLEGYGFKYFFHGGKILLRDLEKPAKEYFDYLSTDLRSLADKIEKGKPLEELDEKEQEALQVLKEIMTLESN